jgi:hypothetical protein
MDEDVSRELWAQAATGLALETLLFSLLLALQRSRVLDTAALARLFDQAEDTCTATALKLGPQAPPEYATGALKIVTELRSQLGLSEG